MSALFMTPDDLQELTGYRRHADQRRWLTTHGWRFEVSATGKPTVSRQYAETMLSGQREEPKRNWQPNRAALSRAA